MTTAIHDNDIAGVTSPIHLRPGTLVYLWKPGEARGSDRRTLAQVQRTTVDHIVGVDLHDRAPARYEVGARYPATLRWNWEVAAPPPSPMLSDGVTFTDREHLDREQRRQLLFGDVGKVLVFHLEGGASVAGIVTEIVYASDFPQWVLVSSPADSQRPYVARIQVEKIAKIMEVGGA